MNLEKLLNPKIIALVGANEKEGFGGNTCRNMIAHGILENIYFINPKREEVFGKKCWPSIASLPVEIDQIVICTPQSTVLGLLKEAKEKGAKSAVLYASGYSETGTEEGKQKELELVAFCQELDIALMGPNCAGFINYNSAVYSFAFIFEDRNRCGSVGLISQSGQICLSVMDAPNMKMSYAVSCGNGSVVSMEDYLEFMVEDQNTKVVAMFLEGITKPDKLIKCLKRAAEIKKPVVVFKVGRSEKGSQTAASHTGSLSGADKVYDAVFNKFGVIRVGDFQELMSTALTLATWPQLPKKSTVGSMSVSGGETGICADVGDLFGIEYPDFTQQTLDSLKEQLPSFATPNNPLDMTAALSYDAEKYAKALKTVMDDPNIGIVMIGYTLLLEIADPCIHYMAEGIEMVLKNNAIQKPIVMLPFAENTRNPEYQEKLSQFGVPILPAPMYGLKIMKYLTDYINFNSLERTLQVATPTKVLKEGRKALTEIEGMKLLREFGIRTPKGGLATNTQEATALFQEIGGAVVMKISSADILHKTDAGGVKLNLTSPIEVEQAFNDIMASCKAYNSQAKLDGIFVQEMLKPGLEVILGVNNDPQFGPMVLCGLGGVFVEIFKDTSLYPAPLNEKEATKMIESLKALPLFKGYRGDKPRDIKALAKTIVAVGEFASKYKNSLKELDINPLFVYEDGEGVCAADALVVFDE